MCTLSCWRQATQVSPTNRLKVTNTHLACCSLCVPQVAVAKKWLAKIQQMNRHTQRLVKDIDTQVLVSKIRVAEAEDKIIEQPEPDRNFFIGFSDGGDY